MPCGDSIMDEETIWLPSLSHILEAFLPDDLVHLTPFQRICALGHYVGRHRVCFVLAGMKDFSPYYSTGSNRIFSR
jgi:hypothetical protein